MSAPLPDKAAYEVDFPIERVEAEHVSRREFAKFLCLVSGGLAAGNAWVAVKDKLFPPFRIPGEYPVCAPSEVPIGGTHPFQVTGSKTPYILIRSADDEWHAYEQKCTHLSCAVYFQPGNGTIECPCHNGAFDVRTGAVLKGPPPRPLPRLKVTVKDDMVYVSELNPESGHA